MADLITIIETSEYKIEAGLFDSVATVRPSGRIDEDFDGTAIFNFIRDSGGAGTGVNSLEFDLNAISHINSTGIRAWILFMERVRTLKIPYRFRMVNEVFLEQASMIPNMLGDPGTPVAAFEVPYFCESCDTRTMKVLKATDIKVEGRKFTPSEFKCEACGKPLEPDIIPEEYFLFLRQAGERNAD